MGSRVSGEPEEILVKIIVTHPAPVTTVEVVVAHVPPPFPVDPDVQ